MHIIFTHQFSNQRLHSPLSLPIHLFVFLFYITNNNIFIRLPSPSLLHCSPHFHHHCCVQQQACNIFSVSVFMGQHLSQSILQYVIQIFNLLGQSLCLQFSSLQIVPPNLLSILCLYIHDHQFLPLHYFLLYLWMLSTMDSKMKKVVYAESYG